MALTAQADIQVVSEQPQVFESQASPLERRYRSYRGLPGYARPRFQMPIQSVASGMPIVAVSLFGEHCVTCAVPALYAYEDWDFGPNGQEIEVWRPIFDIYDQEYVRWD
jgi:hypothetical protein